MTTTKFSIVTPVYNMEKYVEETIQSVLSQRGNFDIEYIIIDGESTDLTEEIILNIKENLEKGLTPIYCNSINIKYSSQPKRGMYTAINNGFQQATGDIYAWIGADDVYRPNTAFSTIANWFASHRDSKWVKGMCGLIDVNGDKIRDGIHKIFYQDWIVQGIYGRETYFIEQESVFWKAELWQKVAPIPSNLRLAGDYWLSIQFAKHAPLDSIPMQVVYFRIRPGQISSNNQQYKDEQKSIYPHRSLLALKVRIFSILINRVSFLKPLWKKIYSMVFKNRRYQ